MMKITMNLQVVKSRAMHGSIFITDNQAYKRVKLQLSKTKSGEQQFNNITFTPLLVFLFAPVRWLHQQLRILNYLVIGCLASPVLLVGHIAF